MGIPAGWYQDLADAGRLRWWDGEAWTSATREREALDGPPTGPSERLTAVDGPAIDTASAGARPVGPVAPSTTAPDTAHLTSAAAAVAAAEAAARLSGAGPVPEPSPARGRAPETARGPVQESELEPAPARSPRTVRIDDRELGHLLDVVPEVPAHLLPLPPERPHRPRLPGRTGRPVRSERAEPAARRTSVVGGDVEGTDGRGEGADPLERAGAVPVPHVTLAPLGRPARRARVSVGRPARAARVPLGQRAARRRTVVTGGAAALVVVLAVGFLLDPASDPPVVAPVGTEDAPVVDPLLDEIPAVPELGAPGADGGPEGEAEATRRVRLPLGGPCGTQEVEVSAGVDPTSLRAWDASACALAPVALAAGEERWIVVRASLDGSAATEVSARASVERARADGLLWSSYYASLNPDLWVVFDGPFASRTEAEAAARAVGGGAYERVLSDDAGDRYCIAPGGCAGGVPLD